MIVLAEPRGAVQTRPAEAASRRRSWQLFAFSSGTYLVLLAVLAANALSATHGRLEYLMDDAYIHLSMAHNLLASGTYGVFRGTYESASSSPGWTLILTALAAPVPAVLPAVPFVLNVCLSLALLWVFWRGLERAWPGQPGIAALTVVVPLVLLLPSLTMAGMEAILQSLLALLVVWFLLRVLGGAGRRSWYALLALTAVSVPVRLEDLFVTAGCVIAILVCGGRAGWSPWRRVRATAELGGAGAVPAILLAAVNLAHGDSWLPNSVLAKSGLIGARLLPIAPPPVVLSHLESDPVMAVLLALALLYLVRWLVSGRAGSSAPAVVAFLVAGSLHVWLAAVGWYDRYEEYLVVTGTWLLVRVALEEVSLGRRTLAVVGVAALLVVSAPRKMILTIITPTASENIYLQQHQMGRFLARYYDGRAVVVNDLGEVSYQHSGPVLDLFGLGSGDVLKARRANRFDASFVDARTRQLGAPVAVIYSSWWTAERPASWRLVGTWSVPWSAGNLGASSVDFWATDPASAPELRQDLEAYTADLPQPEKLTLAAAGP